MYINNIKYYLYIHIIYIYIYIYCIFKNIHLCQAWWIKPVILAIWEAVIGKMVVQGQPGQEVHKTPSQLIYGHGDMAHLNQLSG
jgi:hypothetical protein